MRKLLHIGEVARLLGITQKTIRHYQKIGLLQEPERSDAGYRLYSAQDLLRLHQVRRLQALGLSLKQIKSMLLSEPAQARSLRDVLQSLDQELDKQIRELEARRTQIKALLEDENIEAVEHIPQISPTFAWVKEQLGELITTISPELLRQEEQMDALLDAFQWPDGYQEMMKEVAGHMVANPEQYQKYLAWGELLAKLANLPADAPEVEQVLAMFEQNGDLRAMQNEIATMSTAFAQSESQYSQMMADILLTVLSPAQLRFFQEIERRRTEK